MKRNLALIAVLMLSLLVAGSAFAGSDTDRATGGGLILVGTGGAGTTIAFNARGNTVDADGQVQYIIRMPTVTRKERALVRARSYGTA